ncbi:PKD domain-containing protein [Chloroflexota bacterium]
MVLISKVTCIFCTLVLFSVVIGCTQKPISPPEPTPPKIATPATVTPDISPPTIDFIANPREGQAPIDVTFMPVAIGDATHWHWDFGDRQFSNEKNPTHTYTSNGEYTVSLAVSGASGSNTISKRTYIKIGSLDVINWQDAESYIGENKVVEGVSIDTYYAVNTKSKPTFLNFNKPYKGYFTCIIWNSDRTKFITQFPPNPETHFLNKRVLVRGLIEEYPPGSGIPEIILKEPSQIEIAK